jgi:hypothetical protein
MEIIVPAAGLSSRFPNMKPKYLLFDYEHKMMLEKAVADYPDMPITVGILSEHNACFDSELFIKHQFGDRVKVVILKEMTKGPADTVYQILQKAGISDDAEFLVKDCDSFFSHTKTPGNYICVSDIAEHEVLNRLRSKSFVISNEQGVITDIIEKRVVSNKFCVGGYKFESVGDYKKAFESISTEREIFVSDVISVMLHNGKIFTEKLISNYIDVGTAQEWFKYNDKPVIFCDIDGTIIKAQRRVGLNSYDDEPEVLRKNVEKLLEYEKNGSLIIFTTAREKSQESITRSMLTKLGFESFQLIIGLPNARRILINDFDSSNPFPRAEAVNIQRNSDNLDYYL